MTINKPQTATLIDTISEGFTALNRRPWLIFVPILINAYIIFGTQLSLAPLLINIRETFQHLQSDAQQTSQQLSQSGAALQILFPEQAWKLLLNSDMRMEMAWINYLPILTPMVTQSSTIAHAPPFYISSYLDALGFFIAINLAALLINTLFLTQLAEAVREDRNALRAWSQHVIQTTLAILGYVGIIVGIAVAVGLPFIVFTTLLMIFSPVLGSIALTLLVIGWFWISVYIGFAPEAIFVSGARPIQAIQASFQIVRRNMASTLGLLIITMIVTQGLSIIWQGLSSSLPGLIVAVLGSTYIGCGLLASRMAFYRERLRNLNPSSQIVEERNSV